MTQITSTQYGGLQGALPLQDVIDETVDISEYLKFDFYDRVSYKDNTGLGLTSIGR